MIKVFEKIFGVHKYLFTDLDGTLIETKSGHMFPEDKDDWKLRQDVISAIRNYNPKFLFIISNQGGIEKGFLTHADFINKINNIEQAINEILPDVVISDRYCASNNKNHPERKPNPGMVNWFLEVYDIRKFQCMMIGDASGKKGDFSDSDKRCAENAKIKYLDVEDFIKKYRV